MCGILGYIGSQQATPLLLEGLRRLEYRGYDSVGISTMSDNGNLNVLKTAGRVDTLTDLIGNHLPISNMGIGHSRWATHGPATRDNAHPHVGGNCDLALVHNGVIENHDELRTRLESLGFYFKSGTDSEVIAHLIHWHITQRTKLQSNACGELQEQDEFRSRIQGVRRALKELRGSYALVIMFRDQPDYLLAVCNGSPLIIGTTDDGHLIGSDKHAISHSAHQFTRLEDQELAVIRSDSVQILQKTNPGLASREILWKEEDTHSLSFDDSCTYSHRTLQEIHEQPLTLKHMLSNIEDDFHSFPIEFLNNLPKRILILACGTSYHAGLFGKYIIEAISGIPVEVEYASEFRYRESPYQEGTLLLTISQSGETADTLGALREFKQRKQPTVAICNVPGSTLTEESDATIFLNVGLENGVAATKSYTADCAILSRLAMLWGYQKDVNVSRLSLLINDFHTIPQMISNVLDAKESIKNVAHTYEDAKRFLFIGRGFDYPTALEGALKLKELSYISAEGYAAGELKHGPLALVDDQTITVALATPGRTYEKVLSNLEEIRCRGGQILAIGVEDDQRLKRVANNVIYVQKVDEFLQPLVNIIPLQLFAFYLALARGCDVDRPRNLAKSVTVE
ncbi:MAG: glutamine--fructose-6-phosphate transaminase (isomerizing) [Blastopirellula sp.]|nr:MAG: glutamine--fructose-6-phosphate transaminase (isomerizing) [Blastopirellula sp.]